MLKSIVVRARIDEKIKEEATVVLATMGLSVSDAFRLMLIRVAREKALPFEPLIPNAATITAMKEARVGGLPGATAFKALMDALKADDKMDWPIQTRLQIVRGRAAPINA
jgi:DNA-damage-inducible protein J